MGNSSTVTALKKLILVKKEAANLANDLDIIAQRLRDFNGKLKDMRGLLEDVVDHSQNGVDDTQSFLADQVTSCEQLVLDLKAPISSITGAFVELDSFLYDLDEVESYVDFLERQ